MDASAAVNASVAAQASESAAPTSRTSIDPTTVRAERAQDPAKSGAQAPDGRKVEVKNVRPKIERYGGLAKTGN
ncbi:hypothetical protein AADG42_14275 [Ammonicoccus fulvus]|uniref:Uncharacterized protein n=1 Tax=Ammonicoccus fulvus TaxID=3138240 RepID=A0ABZ3FUK7_9ACTN